MFCKRDRFTPINFVGRHSILHSLLLVAAIVSTTQAQDEWINSSNINNFYDFDSNWFDVSHPGPTEEAQFNLNDIYEVSWDHLTPTPTYAPEVGFLSVLDGDVTFLNVEDPVSPDFAQYVLQINGSGATSDLRVDGSGNKLTIQGIKLHSLGGAELTDHGTLIVDGSHAAGANLTVDGNISAEGTLTIEGGGTLSSNGIFSSIGNLPSSTGVAIVNGPGSNWTHSGSSMFIGSSGVGTLDIRAGGKVTNHFAFIGNKSGSTGVATVTGLGSLWKNSDDLLVGNVGNGTLHVQDSGIVVVASTLAIGSSGTINLTGGSIVTSTFTNNQGGTLNFLAGSLTINSSIVVGPGASFPQNLTLDTHQTLITPATTTVASNHTLTLHGGTLKTNDLTVQGALQFDSGVLELTGGTVTGLSSLTVPTNGTLRATGVYNLPVTATSGSAITATGSLALGDVTDSSGFYSNGKVNIDGNNVTVNDLNDAVFDSGASVHLGNTGTGKLSASKGLTIDFGGNFAGYGAIKTPNLPAYPVINNGHISGNSVVEPISLSGYVKGVGTLDNVVITGTDAPGFSPAAVNRGSVNYQGTLEIELGGTSPGSSFDQLNHILGAGIADLGGTLDVQLINGFIPNAGDVFEIMTATSILDTFDTINLPSLPGDLLWFVNYSATSVELVSTYGADFDEDGDVDDLDLAAWEGGFSSAPAVHTTGDANADTFAGGFDFLTWQRQQGNGGAAVAAVAAVPEPSTAMLLLIAASVLANRCRLDLHDPIMRGPK